MTQAIAGQAVASWFGYPTEIRVGARRIENGGVDFHAWLIWRDTIILGGDSAEVGSFAPLASFASSAK